MENALFSDPRIAEAAAVGVPDARLGEQVAAVVSVRPENRNQVTEKDLIALAQKRFATKVSGALHTLTHFMSAGCPSLLYQ